MTVYLKFGSPRSASGTYGPLSTTDRTIMVIPAKANPDARESFEMSRYSERGNEMKEMHMKIMNLLSVKSQSTGV